MSTLADLIKQLEEKRKDPVAVNAIIGELKALVAEPKADIAENLPPVIEVAEDTPVPGPKVAHPAAKKAPASK